MVHFILYSKIFEAILYQWDSNSELAMFESLVLTFVVMLNTGFICI